MSKIGITASLPSSSPERRPFAIPLPPSESPPPNSIPKSSRFNCAPNSTGAVGMIFRSKARAASIVFRVKNLSNNGSPSARERRKPMPPISTERCSTTVLVLEFHSTKYIVRPGVYSFSGPRLTHAFRSVLSWVYNCNRSLPISISGGSSNSNAIPNVAAPPVPALESTIEILKLNVPSVFS